MLRQVWADSRQCLPADGMPLSQQLLHHLRQLTGRVEDHAVGRQMVVLDALALFIPVVTVDHIPTKRHPILELIELLTLRHRCLDGRPEFRISDIPQQEGRANRTAQLPKRMVKPVAFAARTAQPFQDARRVNPSSLNADAHPQKIIVMLRNQGPVDTFSKKAG